MTKVIKKVAPIALAVGAVVMTGGAALGLTPTFAAGVGSLVGGLGLSTTLTGALTGAVVSAGFGSAVGGATAAATGGNVMKGMQRGTVAGAVTGGVLGAASPATFGINATAKTATTGLMNAGREGITAPATLGAPATAMGSSGVAVPGVAGAPAIAAPAAGLGAPASAMSATAMAPSVAAAAPAAGGGGLMSFLNSQPMLAGSLISGAAKGLSGAGGDGRSYADQQDSNEDASKFAYGGAYTNNPNPFGLKPLGTPTITPAYTPPTGTRWQYDAKTNSIVEVGA